MKRVFTVLLLFVTIAVLAAFVIFQRLEAVVLKNRAAAEATALMESARIARKGAIPFDWSAAAFIPVHTIQDCAKLAEGARITLPPTSGLPIDTVLEVTRLKLATDDGFAIATLKLLARVPSRNIEVLLTASGVLRYLGEDHQKPASEGWRNLRFGIDLTEVRPDVSIGVLQFKVRYFMARLLRSGIATSLGDRCTISVPVPTVLQTSLDLTGQESVKAGDGSIGIAWAATPIRLRKSVEIAGPIFSSKGMWLLASESPAEASPPRELPISRSEARAAVDQALSTAPTVNEQTLIWLNSSVLENLTTSAKKADTGLNAKITSVEGHLYQEEWEFFGHGSVMAEVEGTAGSGSVHARLIETKWKPSVGVEATVLLTGSASVPTHIHLDPGPTGGVGFHVGMTGDLRPLTFTACLCPELVNLEGKNALILRVAGNVEEARLEITTDGNFKCSVGTASVAKVGAAITADLHPEGVPPLLLFSEVPRYQSIDTEGVKLPNSGMELVAAPKKVTVTEKGLLLDVDIHLASANAKKGNDVLLADVERACRDLAIGKPIGSTNVAVLIAGLEFSKNNDIVRFFGNAIHDITKGPGPGNEFVKAVNTVSHDLTKGLGPNNDIRKWFASPGQETGNFLSNSAELAGKVAEKGGKDLEHLGQEVGEVAGKTKEVLIDKPGRWIKKTFGL